MIKKLIIVGNGFDLAHGFKTSYNDFRKAYSENDYMKKFESVSKMIFSKNEIKWYDFELNIEKISSAVFSDNYKDPLNDEYIIEIDKKMNEFNSLFEEIKNLLKSYLKEVTDGKEVYKKATLKEEFETDDAFVISFNYTDVVKQYSDNVEFIHGALSNDYDIVLGFSNDITPMDLATAPYIKYMKQVQKFQLKYLRFLQKVDDTASTEERLKEFHPHLKCLFSGKGGWNFPLKKNHTGELEYDVSGASSSLLLFYKNNQKLNNNCFKKYKNVKELVIMGHGLESDMPFFRELSESMDNIKIIVLYTYDGEEKEALDRKKDVLKKMFGVEEIKIKFYM